MIINRDTWHFRWYHFWLLNGRGIPHWYQENLCHYIRVLIFWAPCTWLNQRWGIRWAVKNKDIMGAIALAVFSITGLLALIIVLSVEFPWQMLGLGITIGTIIGVLTFGWFLAKCLEGTTVPTTIGETVSLTLKYVTARKRKVCPFIEFTEEG